MKEMHIRSIIRKKFVVTTDSKHNYPVVENKLNRDFTVDGPGKVWVSDITYIRTSQGWLYLTVIFDSGDRKAVGWSLSSSLKASDTTVLAWKMAVRNRPITQSLIFHSYRGVEYACNEFKNLLSGYKLVERSMSRKVTVGIMQLRRVSLKPSKLNVFTRISTKQKIRQSCQYLNISKPGTIPEEFILL